MEIEQFLPTHLLPPAASPEVLDRCFGWPLHTQSKESLPRDEGRAALDLHQMLVLCFYFTLKSAIIFHGSLAITNS